MQTALVSGLTGGGCSWKLNACSMQSNICALAAPSGHHGETCTCTMARTGDAAKFELGIQARKKNNAVAIACPDKCQPCCSRKRSVVLLCKCKCQHGLRAAGRESRADPSQRGARSRLIRGRRTKERSRPRPVFWSIRVLAVSAGVLSQLPGAGACGPRGRRPRLPHRCVSPPFICFAVGLSSFLTVRRGVSQLHRLFAAHSRRDSSVASSSFKT